MLQNNRDLLDPLELCYQSLHACGMGVIADGPLLDCLRRAVTFGLFLVRLDVRQDSSRHSAAMTEITDYLGLGRYEDWNEEMRISFLMKELANRRRRPGDCQTHLGRRKLGFGRCQPDGP